MPRPTYAARRRTCFCNLVNPPWLLAAYNPAAIPPRISAVRVDGLGSHFMAPSTTDGGSLACGLDIAGGTRRMVLPAPNGSMRSLRGWRMGSRSKFVEPEIRGVS